MAADLPQYRLGRRLAQRRVIGAGADLDDAARHHLARARAAARAGAVKIDLETGPKAGERPIEIKAGVGERCPARQRASVLDLLLAPAPHGFLERGVVGENPAEMMGIGRAIMLYQARRLDDADDLGIELRRIETVPGNIVERPQAHAAFSPADHHRSVLYAKGPSVPSATFSSPAMRERVFSARFRRGPGAWSGRRSAGVPGGAARSGDARARGRRCGPPAP